MEDELKKNIQELQRVRQLERQRTNELARVHLDILKILLAIIEIRDEYTYLHSQRVTSYVLKIAAAMNFPNAEGMHLRIASLLHDIGKIGIPDVELYKRISLTANELAMIRSHPAIGARILGNVELLAPVVPAVLSHHEHYDGRGHPHGLAGDKIPLGARIIAVADAYDALTSVRPYREALSPEEALNEIIHGAGTQFDPLVVEAFKQVWEEIKDIPPY